MSQALRVVTTLIIQDQRPVFCNILPYSTFPHGLPDGRYALVLQSDVAIPVTEDSCATESEQVHTMSMYASREDMAYDRQYIAGSVHGFRLGDVGDNDGLARAIEARRSLLAAERAALKGRK